jgi:hypothetical protein
MSKRNNLIEKQLKEFLESKGWKKDSYGNYQKESDRKEYRMKFNDISVRYELKIHHTGTEYSKPSSEWMRLKSGYFKDLSVSEKGIKGLT